MALRKKTKVNVSDKWLSKYHDVHTQASLGGVNRFAKAHKLPLKKAQHILEQDLAYTLHKPRRRRFPTLPVIVGGLDDQWVTDLVEVQPLAKYNRGVRYLRVGPTVESQNRGGGGQSLRQDPLTRASTQPFANGSR